MQQAAKLILWQDKKYSDFCVVNDNNAYILTDFMLGDQMTMEVCFKRTTDINTGLVTVGTFMPGVQDYQDYRFFFFNTSTMICDCGTALNTTTGGGRTHADVDDKTFWHIAKFPVLVNSNAKTLLDGVVTNTENSIRSDGNFGVKSNPLTFFSNSQTNASQQIALRYVNIWRFNTDEILASFWPDKRGGFIDTVSKKFYAPIKGEVKIKKWKEV